tara:strand:+ start:5941 stop:6675 length:735 start_codon:yes stop_codon:yes gene_type:complete
VSEQQVKDIQELAKAGYPNEICGIVSKGKFIPMQNMASDKENSFYITPEQYSDHIVDAIVHSHTHAPLEPSEADMECQQTWNVPIGIVKTDGKVVSDVLWLGGEYDIPLIGREFRHGPSGSDGKGDCYALIKDFYKQALNIELKEFSRNNHWWERGNNLYLDNAENAGFFRVEEKDIQEGDIFLAQIRSKKPNHGGVYLGKGVGLHHLDRRLSRREPLNNWNKYIVAWYRHEENIPTRKIKIIR